MMFTVVMPSYLGQYPGAASNRQAKFMRAVDSVRGQSMADWELRIVADGCQDTVSLYERNYRRHNVHCTLIEKRPLWCPGVRNRGIADALGRHIVYLDTDDYFRTGHLEELADSIADNPLTHGWGWFNAYFYNERVKGFVEREADIRKCATYGTGNIVHENREGLFWPEAPKTRRGEYDYGQQDCSFVEELKKLGPGTKLPTPGYMVCHEPNLLKIDV